MTVENSADRQKGKTIGAVLTLPPSRGLRGCENAAPINLPVIRHRHRRTVADRPPHRHQARAAPMHPASLTPASGPLCAPAHVAVFAPRQHPPECCEFHNIIKYLTTYRTVGTLIKNSQILERR